MDVSLQAPVRSGEVVKVDDHREFTLQEGEIHEQEQGIHDLATLFKGTANLPGEEKRPCSDSSLIQ
eukprot:764324-Pelagomonas_calceolata.AAC.2